MHKYYKFFVLLRIILTCLPQSGYIHPDEYFQSVEVIAEKVLGVQANKPWEFNATFPVRSISSMYLTVGLSYHILRVVDYFMLQIFNVTLIAPYFVIVFPRLLICCLSFLVDWCLYKICIINNEKYQSRCIVLSISYIMLVYSTHTFSNTLELFLFALLLYFVAESLILSTTNLKKHIYLDYRYNQARNPVDKAKFRKLKLCLENVSFKNGFIISTITVIGVFNRPTFIAFAVGPIFFWLYREIGFRITSSLSFYFRACLFNIGMIPTMLLYIVIDSFYFGYLTWGEIGVFKVSLDNFVVTPWNFIKYNVNPKNLARHGLHPRYLHAVINMPLLFNILALFFYSSIFLVIQHIIQNKYHYLPSIRSIKGLMLTSLIFPLLILSYIPHQEPRFLIPLILPLVYLYGTNILPETETNIMKASDIHTQDNPTANIKTDYFFKIWLAINIALTLFYGFLHQGGIYSFVSHMNKELKNTQYEYHIITSHIYSIPESLFLQKSVKYDAFKRKYASGKRIFVHENGSENKELLLLNVINVFKYCDKRSGPSCSIHLVMPNTILEELESYELYKNLTVKRIDYFYPHISTESLPCFSITQLLSAIGSGVENILKLFSLISIEIKLSSAVS